MTITDSDLDAIEARAKAATGGVWEYRVDMDSTGIMPDWFSVDSDGTALFSSISGSAHDAKFIAHCGGDNGYVLRLVAEVRRLNADLFDAERKAVHLAEEVGRLKAEIGGQYRDYNMKVITTDEDGNSVTVYGTLRKELERRG